MPAVNSFPIKNCSLADFQSLVLNCFSIALFSEKQLKLKMGKMYALILLFFFKYHSRTANRLQFKRAQKHFCLLHRLFLLQNLIFLSCNLEMCDNEALAAAVVQT